VISFAYNTTVPLEVVFPRAIENTNGLFIYFFIFGEKSILPAYVKLKKYIIKKKVDKLPT
jgi:hypothetical protein